MICEDGCRLPPGHDGTCCFCKEIPAGTWAALCERCKGYPRDEVAAAMSVLRQFGFPPKFLARLEALALQYEGMRDLLALLAESGSFEDTLSTLGDILTVMEEETVTSERN